MSLQLHEEHKRWINKRTWCSREISLNIWSKVQIGRSQLRRSPQKPAASADEAFKHKLTWATHVQYSYIYSYVTHAIIAIIVHVYRERRPQQSSTRAACSSRCRRRRSASQCAGRRAREFGDVARKPDINNKCFREIGNSRNIGTRKLHPRDYNWDR